MRRLAPVALVAVAACQAPPARPLREEDVRAAGEVLASRLRAVELPRVSGRARTVVVVGERSDPLVEAGERRAIESMLFAEVIHDRERKPDYVIVPEKEPEGVTWELIELATKRRVFKVTCRPLEK